MPTREEIAKRKTMMRDSGMKWADMNNESWGPGLEALWKKYLSSRLTSYPSPKQTHASIPVAATATGTPVVGVATAAGTVVNPAARDELTGGPSTLEYTLHDINNWGRENVTPVLHLVVNTVASGTLSALDWLGGMFSKKKKSNGSTSTPSSSPANSQSEPASAQPAPVSALGASNITSRETTASGVSGGTPNPNDDKKKKLQEKAEKTKGWFLKRWKDLGPGQGYSWEGFHTGRNYWNIARDASIYAPAAWDLGTSIVLLDPNDVLLPVPIWGLAPGTNAYRPGENNTLKKEGKKKSEEYPDANDILNQ